MTYSVDSLRAGSCFGLREREDGWICSWSFVSESRRCLSCELKDCSFIYLISMCLLFNDLRKCRVEVKFLPLIHILSLELLVVKFSIQKALLAHFTHLVRFLRSVMQNILYLLGIHILPSKLLLTDVVATIKFLSSLLRS